MVVKEAVSLSTITKVPPSKRGKGRRSIVARVTGLDGEPVEATFFDRDDAKKFVEEHAALKRWHGRPDRTVEVVAKHNLKEIENGLAASTAANHGLATNIVIEMLGSQGVRSIDVACILRFRAALSSKAKTTSDRADRMLRRMLDLAVELELIPHNPYLDLPPAPLRPLVWSQPVDRALPCLSLKQFHMVISASGQSLARTISMLGLLAGLRMGEILRLRKRHVLWDSNDLDIVNSTESDDVLYSDEQDSSSTGDSKTASSNRRVPMVSLLRTYLEALVGSDSVGPETLICQLPNGESPPHATALRQLYFHQVELGCGTVTRSRRQGYTYYDFKGVSDGHGLRHACVAFWIWSGIDEETIAAWLGHSDASLTLEWYGYLFTAKLRNEPEWPTSITRFESEDLANGN